MEENIGKQEVKSGLGVKKIIFRVGLVILATFVLLVIWRMPFVYNKEKTAEQVAKIHATKLTMDDVLGVNLPPDPGKDADKTIVGVDANENGIRDDVELAIFKKYPDSVKTRSELLQYAMAFQMMMTQPILNIETATAATQERSRAYDCIGETLSRDDINKYIGEVDSLVNFVKDKQLNTSERIEVEKNVSKKVRSYGELPVKCNIDKTLLDS